MPESRFYLKDSGLPQASMERVAYLIGYHHTPEDTDGQDYQILLEAGYLVNAGESGHTKEHIKRTLKNMFKTPTGIALLKFLYLMNTN